MEKKPARTNLRGADGDVLQIVALQSRDPSRIRLVLDPRNPIRASILPHVIPLLEDRAVAGSAMQALQLAADTYGGALVDALLNLANDSSCDGVSPECCRCAGRISCTPTAADGV